MEIFIATTVFYIFVGFVVSRLYDVKFTKKSNASTGSGGRNGDVSKRQK